MYCHLMEEFYLLVTSSSSARRQLVSRFSTLFSLSFSVKERKRFKNSAISLDILMLFKRLFIVVASEIRSLVSPWFLKSRRR